MIMLSNTSMYLFGDILVTPHGDVYIQGCSKRLSFSKDLSGESGVWPNHLQVDG